MCVVGVNMVLYCFGVVFCWGVGGGVGVYQDACVFKGCTVKCDFICLFVHVWVAILSVNGLCIVVYLW